MDNYKVHSIEEYLRDKFQITLKPNQIYYWEKKGLLGKVSRNSKNRRYFTMEDIKKIMIILMFHEVSLSIGLIRKIVIDNDQRAKEIAAEKLLLIKNTIIPTLQNYIMQ